MALKLTCAGRAHNLEIVRRRPHLVVSIDGREHEIAVTGGGGDGRHTLEIAGQALHVARAQVGERQVVRLRGRTHEIGLIDPRSEIAETGAGHDEVKAPMPGRVVAIHKSPGEAVLRGEAVATIESMKLQMALAAPRDGRIAAILRGEGDSVDKDEAVARLEALAPED